MTAKPLSDAELAAINQELDDIEGLAPAIADGEHGQKGFIHMRRLVATIDADRRKLARARELYMEDALIYVVELGVQTNEEAADGCASMVDEYDAEIAKAGDQQ